MAQAPIQPVVLVILDGWGYREATEGNAIAQAKTPIMDALWATYPHTLIQTSGKAVGLPDGQMGNSEVGHLNLGAGRVVPQELVRISDAVEDGSLQLNPVLQQLCLEVKTRGSKLHLVGLCSEGGVHSHLDHLIGLIDLAKAQGINNVCIHAITDGRDTNPKDGIEVVKKIQNYTASVGVGQIVTVSGRYYAMDRDRRWDRVQKAYQVMTEDNLQANQSPIELLENFYAQGLTDEFIPPTRIAPGAVEPGDGFIFYNFRPDRSRQLSYAFVDPEFSGFPRELIKSLSFVTFTQYDPNLPVSVVFEPQNLTNILGEVIAQHGLKQFRAAETEKYAHVTYFFNGGLEEPLPGEDREMVSSPMVATYDKAPTMSAVKVTEVAVAAIKKGIYSLVVINYANPDMVGHTGIMEPTIKAIETVDTCLGELVTAVMEAGGITTIVADHGNAECMLDEKGNPWTAHTTNPVPFILVEGEGLKIPGYATAPDFRTDGRLADVAPTILQILKLPQPSEMTGHSLLVPLELDVRPNRTPVRLSI
ncbi:2,3-bisphosphoglycerate-independent phosphoglycerate mutase [Merismopedia glauca]|uniref:2,3-bisphosphoglycerate-independent phosphoglycerate mutase n=1 Tax=Merismopedia glauca CCAP 1448/3 TaxID=1296344 RepID=A0A2T1BWG4_9CYAN|nr:2,3-bisphosphoglycerate-independent phosphoglycerate mutase [Merismopedia glauca]PSB00360.1 2,3-bisphosphoglycerate-independent phosphoglycerate mutase [Merismopedia glauca CCAP 1448/3]